MRDQDFQLIGFDKSFPSEYKSDYALFDEESINFLTQKRVVRKVVGLSRNGKSIFKENWTNISPSELILLSELKISIQ